MQHIWVRQSFTAAVLLAGACLIPPAPLAQEAKPVELRYAAGAPQRSVWGMQVERFAKAVEEESKGTVKIQPYLGGQLGSDVEIIQQVARGRIDMAGIPVPFASPWRLNCCWSRCPLTFAMQKSWTA
jgi:TRAP-type C4-dicarboxylate transport system substrate-binding protein